MALKKRNRVEATFAMSSMTDLVFLLLLFFVMASTMSSPNDIKTMYIALHADEDVAYKEVVRVLDIANEYHIKLVVATKR